MRHRPVPTRILGDKVVVARPVDGAPVVLAATATVVWQALEDWTTPDELGLRLATVFPDVSAAEREAALSDIMAALTDDNLLE